MRELSHLTARALPAPMPLVDVPWMRRERADISLRHAAVEFRALMEADPRFAEYYEHAAVCLEALIKVVGEIEDIA